MARFRIGGIAVFAGIFAAACAHAATYRVLFTSFDPFDGSPTNNTQAIAADLAANPGALGSNVAVDVCNLPVVYDTASVDAANCVAADHPDIVVSLGEADCELRLETAATNVDDTPEVADNAGQFRTGTPIVPGGPDRSGFDFPVQAMYCALQPSDPPVMVSNSPGAFVCNNTAYHLSQELRPLGIPFTFIHVPNAECSADQKDPATQAAIIARMVKAAIANLRAPLLPATLWPHPGNQNLLPTTSTEAQVLVDNLGQAGAPACERNFAQNLAMSY